MFARRVYNARGGEIRGFTLVELLVVVSIIALLIAILLPSLKTAREQARTVKCMANLRSISAGCSLYAQDQKGILPGPLHPPIYRLLGGDDPRFHVMPVDTQRIWYLLYRIGPYFAKNDQLLKYCDAVATCPTAVMVKRDEDFIPSDLGGPVTNTGSHHHPYNYLPNTWANTNPECYFGWVNIGTTWTGFMNKLNGPDPGGFRAPSNYERIKRPSDEWMIGDAWCLRTVRRPSPQLPVQVTMLGTWQTDSNPTDSDNPLPDSPYHGSKKQGTALVYFDGHSAVFQGKDNWVPTFPANKK